MDVIAPCCDDTRPMKLPMAAIDDPEGASVPSDLPPIVDGHVHLFPPRVFEAIWRWFDREGWPIRYKLQTPEVLDFLFSKGVSRVVGLSYAHKPGMARALNAAMAEVMRRDARVLGLATVFPGEPDAANILREAFDAGLKGVKLHCHVQCFSPDSPELAPIYEVCQARARPMVIHAGREPKSEAYKCDPYRICGVERVRHVLEAYPRLKLLVPHLGADEIDGYADLLERHDNLWLDTTMMLAEYFPLEIPRRVLTIRPERIIYGTDFPNIPYAWDRELGRFGRLGIPESAWPGYLGSNALDLYELSPQRTVP